MHDKVFETTEEAKVTLLLDEEEIFAQEPVILSSEVLA